MFGCNATAIAKRGQVTNMSTLQARSKLSLEDFLKLPETEPPSEYIDGKIYQKLMPKGKHSAIQTFLPPEINRIAIPQRIACAFTELRCSFGGRSLVPDISVFSWQRIPRDANGEIENAFEIQPDWTIEILSPDQSPIRVIDNILFCLNHGTELGWFIDPQERAIATFESGKQPEIKQGTDRLPVLNALDDFLQLSVQDVFGLLLFN
jgi:Uma2 family endonuclease